MKDTITMLRGPERVRKRPAVIFGSDGVDGALSALLMLIDTLVQEGIDGHCTEFSVTQYRDNSLELRDNGRGLYLGAAGQADDTVWKELFCQLYAAPRYGQATQHSIFEPAGNGIFADSLELCAVQSASEYMQVCVVRDGYKQTLSFRKGEPVGGLDTCPCTDPSGTNIRFRLDTEVFSDIVLPGQAVIEKMQTIALQISGLKATFRQETETGFVQSEYCYPAGIVDYLQENATALSSPVYTAELAAEGQERYNRPRYAANVKIGIQFTKDAGFIRCDHNSRRLTCGGSHCDAAIEKIVQYLEWTLGCTVNQEALKKHLQLVIITNSKINVWSNGARTGIDNILIRDMTQDTVNENFQYFIKQNAVMIRDLFS